MTMQRRHFELIAEVLRESKQSASKDIVGLDTHCDISRAFADKLAGTNPNFDRERFLAACGYRNN